MNKPRSLRDQRRQEARDALYRAELRRDQIIFSLVQNDARIRRLRRKLTRLDIRDAVSKVPVSVAEGKLLDTDTLALVQRMARELDDDIPDLSGRS